MRKFLCLIFSALIVCLCFGQKSEITGRIIDSTGNGIPRASVKERKTSNGTIADDKGYFKLNTQPGTQLEVSIVGYRPVTISASSNMSIVLYSANNALTEVVVTAQGIRREKKALGYAVSTISKEKVEARPDGDIGRLLSGKAPGVNILSTSGLSGSGTNIIIRAANSLSGSVTPLFIVDGVPFNAATNYQTDFRYGNETSSRFLDIEPNSIETIDVLKGLNATTLYGEAGRNGVIVITTKNGANRKTNDKTEITLTQSVFFNHVANLPAYQNTYGSGFQQQATLAFSTWGARFTNPPLLIPHPYSTGPFADQFPQFAGVQYAYKPYNSVENFFRTGLVTNTAINVNGGNSNVNFNANYAFLSDEGFTPENKVLRNTFGIGGNAKLSNSFTISGTVNYVTDDVKAPPTGYSEGNGAVNGVSVFGDLIYTPRSIDLMGLPYESPVDHSSVYYRADNGIQHPLWTVYNAFTRDKVSRVYGNAQLRYDFFKGLNITYRVGYDSYSELTAFGQNKGGVNNLITGIYRTTQANNQIWYHTLIASYAKELGANWRLNIDAGADDRENYYQQTGMNSTQQLVYGLFDHSNFISHATIDESGLYDLDYSTKDKTIGIFAQSLLGFKEFLYFNLGARKSWVTTLEKGNNSLTYPSASVSFIPTSAFESLSSSNGLNYLKIRAGYSTSARFPELAYTTRPQLNITTNLFVDRNGNIVNSNSIDSRLANNDLKPELQKEIEVGLESKFLNNRANIDLTFYRRVSSDQILDQTLDPSTGYTIQQVNAGNLRNKGIELALGYTVIKSKNVTWQLDGNFSLNRSLVYNLPAGVKQIVLSGFSNRGTIATNGQPLGVIYGTYAVLEPKTGLPIVTSKGDYQASTDSKVIGNPNPDYKLSGISTLTIKGFSFRMQWDFTKGGDIYSSTISALLARGLTKDTDFDRDIPIVLPGVDANGNPNTVQTTATNAYFNHFSNDKLDQTDIYDATVIRLREMSFSYSFSQSLLRKSPFGGVTFSLTGQNLWYLAPNVPRYTRFDPETTSLGVGNSTAGFEYQTAPSSRRIGMSLKLTF